MDSIDPTSSSSQVRRIAPLGETQASRPSADYSSHFSSEIQASISAEPSKTADPSLSHLQEEIKSTMIPLLIDIFSLKEAAQQAKSPPTRLSPPPQMSAEEVREKLSLLKKDLETASLWIQTCLTQVKKAQDQSEEAPAATSTLEKRPSWFKRAIGG